jgi:hypothetical protein
MKEVTPIQEWIYSFEEMRNVSPNSKLDLESAISLTKSMLDKEKEVIIETSKNSYIAGYLDNQAKIDESMNFPNEYYNTTFNTKDK